MTMSNGSKAAARAPAAVLEDLAGAVMAADASDERAVQALLTLLDELGALPAAAEAAARIRAASADVRALAAALDAASEAVARMQDDLARGPAVAAAAAADGAGSRIGRAAEAAREERLWTGEDRDARGRHTDNECERRWRWRRGGRDAVTEAS
jgi:hypothetical protein